MLFFLDGMESSVSFECWCGGDKINFAVNEFS